MSKLKINNQTYKLPTKNYCKGYHSKQQIVLCNTFSDNMGHFNGWKTRHSGRFKRTTAYTVDINGNIFQHFQPQFYSNFFGISGLDEHIITISIENEGWLSNVNDEYYNYSGSIYNRRSDVVKRTWRNQKYWAPYNDSQVTSTAKLCGYLCEVFGIAKQAVAHNTKLDDIYDFDGVAYKSNFNKHYTDISPSWDFSGFKNKLETI